MYEWYGTKAKCDSNSIDDNKQKLKLGQLITSPAWHQFDHMMPGVSKGFSFQLVDFLTIKGEENDAWCAFITDTQQYIQLDFTRNTCVTRIVTYGRGQKSHWVKRYILQYSSDFFVWHNYTENGFVKVRKSQSFVFLWTPSPTIQMYC